MGKLVNLVLVAAGSFVAGVLLAPKSGKETRKDLKTKANGYKDSVLESEELGRVKKGAASVKEELVGGAESFKGIAKDAADDAKYAAERLKDEAAHRAKAIRENVNQTTHDVKRSAK